MQRKQKKKIQLSDYAADNSLNSETSGKFGGGASGKKPIHKLTTSSAVSIFNLGEIS
ncbi:hypothetical protein [Pseudomethylobacillus aquaticus]|uniref:hypothetical protein n=1 Tax=Pseudomethylobacillus aquaticus TaxID=2676064 RepID=UPI0012D81409|nr:hypothetical protein [Pseudomethylobacillus aquaticus]